MRYMGGSSVGDGVVFCFVVFFFQAEDGIRDDLVTGVQTCALPISRREGDVCGRANVTFPPGSCGGDARVVLGLGALREIGRASCRERV